MQEFHFENFHHTIGLILIIIAVVFSVSYGVLDTLSTNLPSPLGTEEAFASASDNVSGFAWSSNIGWLSFNCKDDSSYSSPTQDTCASHDYGVNVDTSGNFSGYAWSSHIGWVTFAPAVEASGSGCTTAPCNAKVNFSTGAVTGWARACTVFASGCSGSLKSSSELGGWDGWIKMSGTWTNPVMLNLTTSRFSGFAWGGDVVGWLNFALSTDPTTGVYLKFTPPDVNLGTSNSNPVWNTPVTLTWTVTGVAESCSRIGGDFGWETPSNKTPTGGSEATDNITAPVTFSIQCQNPAGLSPISPVIVQPQTPFTINIDPIRIPTTGQANVVTNTKFKTKVYVDSTVGGFAGPVSLTTISIEGCNNDGTGCGTSAANLVRPVTVRFCEPVVDANDMSCATESTTITAGQYATGKEAIITFGASATNNARPRYKITVQGASSGMNSNTPTLNIYTKGTGTGGSTKFNEE